MKTGVKPTDPGDLCVQCGRCCHFRNGRPCPCLKDNLCSIYRLRLVVHWCRLASDAFAEDPEVLPSDCPVRLALQGGSHE